MNKDEKSVPQSSISGGDLSERKRTEDLLRESESKYKTLVGNLPQKIFLKYKGSVYISCNSSFAADLKIKPQDSGERE